MRTLALLSIALVSIAAVANLVAAKPARDNTVSKEIQALREWAERAAALHKRVSKLYKVGALGGEVEKAALTRYQMLVANAQLALAKRRVADGAEFYAGAVEAARRCLDATTSAYEAGTVPLDSLVRAQQRVAEAKITLSRVSE